MLTRMLPVFVLKVILVESLLEAEKSGDKMGPVNHFRKLLGKLFHFFTLFSTVNWVNFTSTEELCHPKINPVNKPIEIPMLFLCNLHLKACIILLYSIHVSRGSRSESFVVIFSKILDYCSNLLQ